MSNAPELCIGKTKSMRKKQLVISVLMVSVGSLVFSALVSQFLYGIIFLLWCLYRKREYVLYITSLVIGNQISVILSRQIGASSSDDLYATYMTFIDAGVNRNDFRLEYFFEPLWFIFLNVIPKSVSINVFMYILLLLFGLVVVAVLYKLYLSGVRDEVVLFIVFAMVLLNVFFVVSQLSKQSLSLSVLLLGLLYQKNKYVYSSFFIHNSTFFSWLLLRVIKGNKLFRYILSFAILFLLSNVVFFYLPDNLVDYINYKVYSSSKSYSSSPFVNIKFFFVLLLVFFFQFFLYNPKLFLVILVPQILSLMYADAQLLIYRIFIVFDSMIPLLFVFNSYNSENFFRKRLLIFSCDIRLILVWITYIMANVISLSRAYGPSGGDSGFDLFYQYSFVDIPLFFLL